MEFKIVMIVVLAVFSYPFILTIYELISMVSRVFDHVSKFIIAVYDYFALLIGIILEYMLLELGYNVLFNKQWFEELHNSELHMPINTDYALTFAVLFHLFFAGMFILSATDTNERPPLVTLFCFAGMYIGVIEAVLFTIQIMGMNYTMEGGKEFYCYDAGLLFTLFIPVNMIIMTIRVMLVEIQAYKIDENRMSKVDSVPFLKKCNGNNTWAGMSPDNAAQQSGIKRISSILPENTAVLHILFQDQIAQSGVTKQYRH